MENKETQKKFSIIEFYKKNSLVCNFAVLSLLFLANCFLGFVTYIALPLAYIMILFTSTKNSLSHIIFIFPFVWFDLAFGMIMLVVCLITWIIKMLYIKVHKEKVKLNYTAKTVVAGLACIVFCALPISGIFNIHILIKICFVISVLALIYFMIKFPEEIRLKYNVCVLAVALLIASCFAAFKPVSVVLQNMIETYKVTSYITRFSALFYNPNNLARVCEICLCILAYYFATNKCSKTDVFSFLVFLILDILTFSKGFAAIFVAVMITLFVCAIKYKSKICWTTIGFSIVCLLVLLIIQPEILNIYLNRIIIDSTNMGEPSDVVNAITTSRFDIWLNYINYLFENPLALFFGVGLGAPRIGQFNPHNLFISMTYQLGLVGVLLLIVAIVFIVLDAKRLLKSKISKAVLIPLVLIAVLFCIEDFLFYVA